MCRLGLPLFVQRRPFFLSVGIRASQMDSFFVVETSPGRLHLFCPGPCPIQASYPKHKPRLDRFYLAFEKARGCPNKNSFTLVSAPRNEAATPSSSFILCRWRSLDDSSGGSRHLTCQEEERKMRKSCCRRGILAATLFVLIHFFVANQII